MGMRVGVDTDIIPAGSFARFLGELRMSIKVCTRALVSLVVAVLVQKDKDRTIDHFFVSS